MKLRIGSRDELKDQPEMKRARHRGNRPGQLFRLFRRTESVADEEKRKDDVPTEWHGSVRR